MGALELIEKRFILFLFFGIFLGIFFNQFFSPYVPWLAYFMMAVMFLSFLKIDYKLLLSYLKRPGKIVFLALYFMIIIPLAVLMVSGVLAPEYALGGLLVAALPVGMASTAFAELIKANSSITLVLTVLTHLMVPFTLPALFLLVGHQLDFDALAMFLDLAFIIFVPIAFALLFKKFFPGAAKKHEPLFSPLMVLILALLVLPVAVSQVGAKAFSMPGEILAGVAYALALLVAMVFTGWFLPKARDRKERTSLALMGKHRNIAVGIVIATKYFAWPVVLVIIGYELLIDAGTVFVKWLGEKA